MQQLAAKLLAKAMQRIYQAAETEEEKSADGVGIGEEGEKQSKEQPRLER